MIEYFGDVRNFFGLFRQFQEKIEILGSVKVAVTAAHLLKKLPFCDDTMGDIIMAKQQGVVEGWFSEDTELLAIGPDKILIAVQQIGSGRIDVMGKAKQRGKAEFIVII